MDPNTMLDELRELADIVFGAHVESATDYECVSPIELEFAEKFQALDAWLSNGGFAPTPWQRD